MIRVSDISLAQPDMPNYYIRMRIVSADQQLNIELTELVRQDCAEQGRGRKVWWAKRLGVSPMTLSHWICGRRQPSARHLQAIQVVADELESARHKSAWSDLLWQHYYDDSQIPGNALALIIQQLVRSSGLDTRLIALLSYLLERIEMAPIIVPRDTAWGNRLGWLLESAGRSVQWNPAKKPSPTSFIEISDRSETSDQMLEFIEGQRTPLGRRWDLYDCDISQIKKELAWRKPSASVEAG